MCAAEDRILGFEIVARANQRWYLHYNSYAQAATDVPKSVDKLIGQRRRWLNGSFFATLDAINKWGRMLAGNRHPKRQRAFFVVQWLVYVVNIILTW